jgi:cobalt-zinc-cadmium resistance protein CzcA
MPILMMTRVEGKLFSPMALTLSFAVIGSMVFALTVIPVLTSFIFQKVINENHEIKEHHNFVLTFLIKYMQNSFMVLDVFISKL